MTPPFLHARPWQEAAWRKRVAGEWNQVRVEGVEAPTGETMRVGHDFPVKVRVHLGGITPGDVEVQLCYGLLDAMGEIAEPRPLALSPNGKPDGRSVIFHGTVPCQSSGQFGFSVRVLPKHPNLPHLFEPGLVTWG